jgi:hypothetical protein
MTASSRRSDRLAKEMKKPQGQAPSSPSPRIGLPEATTLSSGPFSKTFLRHDRAAPRARYEAMAARLNNPRRVECNGSHQAMQTQPDAVASALLAATAGA